MKKIIVSSKNPVKIAATERAFTALFPDEEFEFTGASVDSGVSDQPMGEDETFEGAKNRAENAMKEYPDADYWVGIEGGLVKIHGGLMNMGWMVVRAKHNDVLGRARALSFCLPDKVSELIDQGLELGDADDQVFGESNSKQKNGSIGILSNNVVQRADYYEQAIVMALTPFTEQNKDLF